MLNIDLDAIRRENQEELPQEDRLYEANEEPCLYLWDRMRCTKKKHKSGDHIAHGVLGEVVARCKGAAK